MTVREAVRSALGLLSPRDRRLLWLAVAVQMCASILDLIGVLLIGVVGALAVTTVQSQPPPSTVEAIVSALGLEDIPDQVLVGVFAAAAAIVLLTKSVVSSYLTRRVLVFLANRQALVSARLAKALLSMPLTFIQKRSSQETAYALINGASAATLQILGLMVIALTELSLLLVLAVALLFLSPWIAVGAIAFFSVVAFGLHRAMGGWASKVGIALGTTEIVSLNAVQEALGAYREITVADRRPMYVDRIQKLRWQAAKVSADWQFISMFPKYLFEAALVIGGFVLAAVLFATQDSVAAVGTLALFLAAGSRVMPSLLRLQGATVGLRGAAGSAMPTFELARELGNPVDTLGDPPDYSAIRERIGRGHLDFTPSICLRSITVTYPGSSEPALQDVSLDLPAGKSLALVGRSGAGKSTLADVILGVLDPDSGSALLGGLPPADSVKTWPGGVAYVPQEVVLANDTVRSNVALGLPAEAIDDEGVWNALERAHLADFLRENRDGLDTLIGEKGVKLSGGQRQRLGIARALYTRPRLLVLDEATSALDAETEESVARMIQDLEGDVTTVIVAHRLSTIRHVDQIAYLDGGRLIATGSFQDVRVLVPAFDKQASLMGLAN